MSAKFEHRLINIDWGEYFAEKISKIEWELKISLWSQIHILYIDISGAARLALRRNRIDRVNVTEWVACPLVSVLQQIRIAYYPDVVPWTHRSRSKTQCDLLWWLILAPEDSAIIPGAQMECANVKNTWLPPLPPSHIQHPNRALALTVVSSWVWHEDMMS